PKFPGQLVQVVVGRGRADVHGWVHGTGSGGEAWASSFIGNAEKSWLTRCSRASHCTMASQRCSCTPSICASQEGGSQSCAREPRLTSSAVLRKSSCTSPSCSSTVSHWFT